MLFFYQLTKLFNLSRLHEITFSYIARWFNVLVNTRNFLELDYSIVSKILASSNLNITSEIEVYNSAAKWLGHNIKDRSKYAVNIFLTVRLPLLSDHALKYILDKSLSSFKVDECIAISKEIFQRKNYCFQNKSNIYHTSRYCNNKSFNVLVCGGYYFDVLKDVKHLNAANFKNEEASSSMINRRFDAKAVCVMGDVYVFGGFTLKRNWIMAVEKYSLFTNTWTTISDFHDSRVEFCVCAFMDKVFVFGGLKDPYALNSCFQFDPIDYQWKEVARMNEVRVNAACTVFEERIVVSGGHYDGGYNNLRTVESYDVVADTWYTMPNMINIRSYHSLVVVKTKLFVIDDRSCEVFDNTCKQFVLLKSPKISIQYAQATSIGSKIVAFQNGMSSLICYDVDTGKWSEEPCEVTSEILDFFCVKVPRL